MNLLFTISNDATALLAHNMHNITILLLSVSDTQTRFDKPTMTFFGTS